MRRFAVLAAFAAMVFVAAVSPLAQRGPDRAGLARLQGGRGHAPAQRLAHRAGRAPHHRRRSADEPGALARRPLRRHLHQRLRRSRPSASSTPRTSRSSAGSSWSTPGSGWSGIRTASGCSRPASSENVVYEFTFEAGRLTAAGSITIGPPETPSRRRRDRQRRLRRRHGAERRRRAALRHAALRAEGPRHRPQDARRSWPPRSSRRSRTPACSRPTARRCSSRCGAARRSLMLDAATLASKGEIAGRRASQRDGALARRRAAVRRLRQHQRGVGGRRRREAADRADRRRARRRGAGRIDAQRASRSRPTAGRCSSPTPTTTPSPSSTCRSRARRWCRDGSRSAGIRPASCSIATARRLFVLDGKGLTGMANPRGPQPGGARVDGAVFGRDVPGQRLGDPAADRRGARADDRQGPRAHALLRRAPAGAGQRARRLADSAPGRRAVADQARLLRHPREPHLRSGPRRPAEGQRRSVADALRRGRHAQRARAARRVRDVRQLLRGRRGQLRRPRVLHRRLRHRLRREDVAGQLRPPRGAVPERRGLQDAQPVRQHRGAARRATSGTSPSAPNVIVPQLRRVRRTGTSTGRKMVASVPGLDGHIHPTYPPFDMAIPDVKRIEVFAEEFKQFDAAGTVPRAVDPPPAARPHQRHQPRRASTPTRDDRRQRPGARPAGRRHLAQRDLEGVGDLRPRRRRAERAGSRRRAPLDPARRSARSPAAASSTARSTRRQACCARWS